MWQSLRIQNSKGKMEDEENDSRSKKDLKFFEKKKERNLHNILT